MEWEFRELVEVRAIWNGNEGIDLVGREKRLREKGCGRFGVGWRDA